MKNFKREKRKHPFGIPEGYFPYLENKILEKTIEEKNNEIPFKVPNNYFISLEKDILSKSIHLKNKNKLSRIYKLYTRYSYFVNSAAVFVFLFITIILLYINKEEKENLAFIKEKNQATSIIDSLYLQDSKDSEVRVNPEKKKVVYNSDSKSESKNQLKKVSVKKGIIEDKKTSEILYTLYLEEDNNNPDLDDSSFMF